MKEKTMDITRVKDASNESFCRAICSLECLGTLTTGRCKYYPALFEGGEDFWLVEKPKRMLCKVKKALLRHTRHGLRAKVIQACARSLWLRLGSLLFDAVASHKVYFVALAEVVPTLGTCNQDALNVGLGEEKERPFPALE